MSIDNNTILARLKIHARFGTAASNIRFGKIRRDGTRSVKFYLNGTPASYTYLTDVPSTGIKLFNPAAPSHIKLYDPEAAVENIMRKKRR